MGAQVRRIKPTDYEEIITVIKKTYIHSFGKIYPPGLVDEFCKKYDLEKFKKKVAETDYFIAEDSSSGKLLGIIGLRDNQLRTFFVDPDSQGQGIGRQLFNRLEEEAIKRGVKELILEGSPLGEPIYRRFGFKKIKTIYKERKGFPYSDAYMKKKL